MSENYNENYNETINQNIVDISNDIPILSMNIPINSNTTNENIFNLLDSSINYDNSSNFLNFQIDEPPLTPIGTQSNNPYFNPYTPNPSLSSIFTGLLNSGTTQQDRDYQQALNDSFSEQKKYKKVISEKGKQQLKEIVFKNTNTKTETLCCPIIQEPFEDGETIIELPCSHKFNKEAINKWLENENNCCPVCRFQLDNKEIENKDVDTDSSFNFTETSFPPPPPPPPQSQYQTSYTGAYEYNNLLENLTNQILYESSMRSTNTIYQQLFTSMLNELDLSNNETSV